MEKQDEKIFMEQAFKKLLARGWLNGNELVHSQITDTEIGNFEDKYQIKLPAYYSAFLRSYRLPEETFQINGIAYRGDEIAPLWLLLYGIDNLSFLSEQIEEFRQIAVECCRVSSESCKFLIPIGDWGAGWGPLCLDLTKQDENTSEDDEETWSLVWFDHEEFDWTDLYLGEDGLLHGTPAAPNLRTLLEWYFLGSLEQEFEAENQVKVSYERLNDREFCNSYWEERWK